MQIAHFLPEQQRVLEAREVDPLGNGGMHPAGIGSQFQHVAENGGLMPAFIIV